MRYKHYKRMNMTEKQISKVIGTCGRYLYLCVEYKVVSSFGIRDILVMLAALLAGAFGSMFIFYYYSARVAARPPRGAQRGALNTDSAVLSRIAITLTSYCLSIAQ